MVAGLGPELMLTPPGILGLAPGPCALGPLLLGLAPPLTLTPGGRLGGALAVGCGGGFEGEGPPLRLTPGGRLFTGLGPPLTLMPGGSLEAAALVAGGLGPPDTLTPSPDSRDWTSCEPESGCEEDTEIPSLLSLLRSLLAAGGGLSSADLLTWMPSPASLSMLLSELLWI